MFYIVLRVLRLILGDLDISGCLYLIFVSYVDFICLVFF